MLDRLLSESREAPGVTVFSHRLGATGPDEGAVTLGGTIVCRASQGLLSTLQGSTTDNKWLRTAFAGVKRAPST